jgi:hypothetical protein
MKMKKLILIIIVLTTMSIIAEAQIPNNDFENWTNNITASPEGWLTFGKITQVSPGFSGNYAIRIERDSLNPGAPGAILYGTPTGNTVSGGTPFTDRPDSLVGFFKYNIKTGDSAWILVSLKLKGIPVSNDTGYIIGTDTAGFERIALKIHYLSGETPDSLILAVTSTNPDRPLNGSYIIVDSLHFINTDLVIPNGDFETWAYDTVEEPVDWYTSNRYYFPNATLPVTKTTDSYSGTYAIRIENVNYVNGFASAFAFAGPQGNNGPKPGFAVSERELFFEGYYKFFPQNNDTMIIGVMMYDKGIQVGWGFIQDTISKSSYTYFAIPVNYSNGFAGAPDSATVVLLPFNGGPSPMGNSVLFVDSIGFNNQMKLDQTITFGTLPTKTVDKRPFELYGRSSSGLRVTYTSSNSDVAVISGITVILTGVGTTEITASQLGNEYYNPATPVTQTLTVLPTGIGTATSEILKIYPSPATGPVMIQSAKLMNKVSIYNLLGKMMNQYEINSFSGRIDLSNLSNGLYLIKIQCGETEYIRKIEKK